MSWFGRAKGPRRIGTPVDAAVEAEPAVHADRPVPFESGPFTAPESRLESTDTVGNPIVQRQAREAGARHAAPDAGPTRAEHRMLQFVAEGRVARTATGGAAAAFWRIDGAFATGTKAMMLDWLFAEGYVELGKRGRVTAEAVLTTEGRSVLEGRG